MESVLRKVSIWHKQERDRQKAEDDALTAEGSQAIQSLSMEEQLAKKRQIFAPQEAYKMLANELEKLMMEPVDGVAVDAVDHNVWHWDMYLSDFSAGTPIAQASLSPRQTHLCRNPCFAQLILYVLHPVPCCICYKPVIVCYRQVILNLVYVVEASCPAQLFQ